MAGKSILMGTSTRYEGGAVAVGVAPAKVTSATMRLGNNGSAVKLTVGLPTDPNFSSYSVFVKEDPSTTEPTFPGGSPFVRDNTSKRDLDGLRSGVRVHAWIVTRDKYNTPVNPVAPANTFYAGSIVPRLATSLSIG